MQIYIPGVSVDLRNRTKQEAEMPAMPKARGTGSWKGSSGSGGEC